jgi:hypothetical protein
VEALKRLAATDICLMSRNVWVYYLEEDQRFLGLPPDVPQAPA